MYDLSLHLLDIIENSLNAGATTIEIGLRIDPVADILELTVDDNGPGLGADAARVLNPFYTTKADKRTGLGLSLLQSAAEQAQGSLALQPSPRLGGLRVEVRMQHGHVDRPPLGDLAATVSTMVSAHPTVTFRLKVQAPDLALDFDARRDLPETSPVFAAAAAYEALSTEFKRLRCS